MIASIGNTANSQNVCIWRTVLMPKNHYQAVDSETPGAAGAVLYYSAFGFTSSDSKKVVFGGQSECQFDLNFGMQLWLHRARTAKRITT